MKLYVHVGLWGIQHRLKGESVSAAAADSNFWMSATDTWTNSEQFTCLCADKDILGPS